MTSAAKVLATGRNHVRVPVGEQPYCRGDRDAYPEADHEPLASPRGHGHPAADRMRGGQSSSRKQAHQ